MQQHGFIMFIKHTKFMAEGVMLEYESSQSITFSKPSFPKAKQAKKKKKSKINFNRYF